MTDKLRDILSEFEEFDIIGITGNGKTVSISSEFPDLDIKKRAAAILQEFLNNKERILDKHISDILRILSIPPNIKGYGFLRYGIRTIVIAGTITSMTKEVYPGIARHYKVTASQVERAIRHAIEVSWSRIKPETANNLFGMNTFDRNYKPTNSELIALIVDKILVEGIIDKAIS